MVRVLQLGQGLREAFDGRLIVRAWSVLTEGFMGALVIVFSLKGIKAALLGAHAAARRPRRLRLQSSVHSLVAAVLIWAPRHDSLRTNSQTHPPNRKLGQPSGRETREGRAVVRANCVRQAELAKRAFEDFEHGLRDSALESLAAE
jgi:hypothetical protein